MACYAVKLGDCSGRITREHYISRSVLEIAGQNIQISGFPWQETNEPMEIGINSLTSNILCRFHNTQLSSIDESGREFLQALKTSFDQAVSNTEFTSETFIINGIKLELWLLKILCGIFTSIGNVHIPESWVDFLFERRSIPDDYGMHVFGKAGGASWFFNLVRVISVQDKNGNISGAKFGIGGLAILLAFGKPKFHEDGFQSFYRPNSIEIKKNNNIKRIDFLWPDDIGKGAISLNIEGLISDTEYSFFNPIVLPNRKQNES